MDPTTTADSTALIVGLLIGFAIAGGIGALIGRSKGRTGEGFAWGLFLGAIGWIIIACRKPTQAYLVSQAMAFAHVQALAHQQLHGYPPLS